MQLETFQFAGEGWSVQNFPDMDSKDTLILVFAAPEYLNAPASIKQLSDFYSQSTIVGCSSAGEIAGAYVSDHSLSVAVMRFEKTVFKVCAKAVSMNISYQVGKELANELDQDNLRGLFVLSEGLNINGSELVKGLNTINKPEVIITGGLAGDGSAFKQTWTLFNDKIMTNHVVAIGFYGDNIHISHGSEGGWDIFGPERRITRSENNILYELDNKPALTLYKEYLGERALGLPATGLLFPLAIRKDASDTKHLVRTILNVDENTKSLIFAGDMPLGYLARLMRANFDKLISGAAAASQMAQIHYTNFENRNGPYLLLAISCVGRRLLLGERSEEETELTLDFCPKGTQQVGFYSYGELSPHGSGTCDLHNQTMTLTMITEDI